MAPRLEGAPGPVAAIDMIFSELSVAGSYTELCELMALHAKGKVRLHTQRYTLDDVDTALADLHAGRVRGRGVLVPS